MPVTRVCSHCGRTNRIPAKYLASTGRCGVCKSPLPPLAVDEALFDEIVQTPPCTYLLTSGRSGAGRAAPLLLRWREPPQKWRGKLSC
jgi:hypothetical protein